MQLTPKESPQSLLSEEFRTLIQTKKAEWYGSLPPDRVGDSTYILASGTNFLMSLVQSLVDPQAITATVLDSLDWGDGSVDLTEQISATMKRVIVDVIEEFGKDCQDR